MGGKLTNEELGGKVDAHVAVPRRFPAALDGIGYLFRLNLLDVGEDAVAVAEADNDFGDAEEEGLDPELHELAVEVVDIAVVANGEAGLELDPVCGSALFLGFRVPDCLWWRTTLSISVFKGVER